MLCRRNEVLYAFLLSWRSLIVRSIHCFSQQTPLTLNAFASAVLTLVAGRNAVIIHIRTFYAVALLRCRHFVRATLLTFCREEIHFAPTTRSSGSNVPDDLRNEASAVRVSVSPLCRWRWLGGGRGCRRGAGGRCRYAYRWA